MTREEVEQEQVLNGFTEMMKGFLKNQDLEVPNFKKPCKQEPCEDYISRQAVLDAMYELCDTGETLNENPWRDNPHIDAITDAIDNLPSVTPQPGMGLWIDDGFYAEGHSHKAFHCSKCGHNVLGFKEDLSNYCPNCRAKMEVEE